MMDSPPILSEYGQITLRKLLQVWFQFERDLNKVPIIKRLIQGTFTQEDYANLLKTLKPQVVEGSRWISRCASSFDSHYSDVRSIIIGHSQEEHRDYELLESDYVALGGALEDIQGQVKNPGSEALHAYMMFQSSLPNPTQMLGAMWIIEGLGNKMASEWASHIQKLTGCSPEATKFLRYHGKNDEHHMQKLYQLLDKLCTDTDSSNKVILTATVIARLYALQLEEIDNA